MDFNSTLRRAIKTGNVILGHNNTEKCIKEGIAKMVVIATNTPLAIREGIKSCSSSLSVYTFDGTSVALGKACGKPFMVSTLTIVDPGESDILSFKRE